MTSNRQKLGHAVSDQASEISASNAPTRLGLHPRLYRARLRWALLAVVQAGATL